MKKLALIPLIAYLPIFLRPSLLIARNNDLSNFFAPILLFIKNSVLHSHQIPFWNPHIFSGTPLLPDPQSQVFYPGTLLFILFPISTAFLFSLYLHGLIGCIGTYLLCKKFEFTEFTSFLASVFFALFPRIFGYLEAGHWGIFTAYSWLPVALLFTLLWAKKRRVIWASLLCLVLFFILCSHIFIFVCSIAIVVTFYAVVAREQKLSLITIFTNILFLVVSVVGLSAIFLLPQLSWTNITTRSILIKSPDLYPKWSGLIDMLSSLIWPLTGSIKNLLQKDSEKWIVLGVVPLILAFFGFIKIRLSQKLIILFITIGTCLLAFSSIFSELNVIKLMRITTRPWLFVEIIIFFLSIFWIEKVIKNSKRKVYLFMIIFAVLVEFTFLSWTRILRPFTSEVPFPEKFIDIFKNDQEIYRVYCTTRCIPQYIAIKNNLELVEGYGTLQQENYFKHSWSLIGAYWNYYTLAIPPMGTSIFEKPQPSAQALGDYNTKYVLSPYPLTDINFVKINEQAGIDLYFNRRFLPRIQPENKSAFFEFLSYTPNSQRVRVNSPTETELTYANVFSPGWSAKLDEKITAIAQTPISLMRVSVPKGDHTITFSYTPINLPIGIVFTIITIVVHLTLIGLGEYKNRKYNNFK